MRKQHRIVCDRLTSGAAFIGVVSSTIKALPELVLRHLLVGSSPKALPGCCLSQQKIGMLKAADGWRFHLNGTFRRGLDM